MSAGRMLLAEARDGGRLERRGVMGGTATAIL